MGVAEIPWEKVENSFRAVLYQALSLETHLFSIT